jgi:sterol desaturase/sphingolipid hydroxylase (fatty acid hydroxylase superfamily)
MVPTVVLTAAIVMMVVEAARPGRRWPRVRGWWARAALLNACQAGAVLLAGVTWDGWMRQHRPWSADALGTPGGALAGYLVITFVYYWWHRWRHEVPLLWRWFHQVHHSPQRIEVVTSFYKHPFELIANGVLSSAVLYFVVGLGPSAATLTVLLTGVAELFYHWNVSTPHWLGYVVQRPESHCVHHEEGGHKYNYSDLPIWDMLFGTFENPRAWAGRCGFGREGEGRLAEMLAGVDVTAPAVGEAR